MAIRYGFFTWLRLYIRLPFLLGIAGILFITFFNENNVMQTYEYDMQIDSLKAEIKNTDDTLIYYKTLNEKLSTDRATMERIVREQYHMQKPNEDVYIFE